MLNLNLFSIKDDKVSEIKSCSATLEIELQRIIEGNMFEFFGVRFLASEYSIKEGRMDSLGLDENFCPVILEYKRSTNENVINQGLFYLDWLVNHKSDFKLLVIEKFGKDVANKIDWMLPYVICIANNFTKFDLHAINQMQKNVRLIRYKKFGDDLIMFEHLNTPSVKPTKLKNIDKKTQLNDYSLRIQNLYISIRDYIFSLGDDITENKLKYYTAFKKVRNFVSIAIYKDKVILWLKIEPKDINLEEGFTRDVSDIGHHGTGDLEVTIREDKDLKKSMLLIEKAYNIN